MNMQTFHPVFTSGQVLTSSHLNSQLTWLVQQDRATRNKLIGIGIVCGLDVYYDSDAKAIELSRGCALTSEGHLIIEESSILTQHREYNLPVSDDVDAVGFDSLDTPSTNYPFFIQNENPIPMWELLSEDFETPPGEADPQALTDVFINDKVVVLFLECTFEALKNCELNDCSDKGARLNFTVRKLLINRIDADTILATEAAIAGRPVDQQNHPKYGLAPLQLEKINLFSNGVTSFSELRDRIINIAGSTLPVIEQALKDSYSAYSYLVSHLFPVNEFPNGPFDIASYFFNIEGNVTRNPLAIQHYYDVLYDLVQSYNEFIDHACRLEAECCPAEDRFPKHVFLGVPATRNEIQIPEEVVNFDPLSVDFEFGVQVKPQAYRHHFIFSPLFDGQQQALKKIQSLFIRTWMLAYRFQTDGFLQKELRITPSKWGDYALSEKALPYYYREIKEGSLHRNWSFELTVKNRLSHVFSHSFIDLANHPLRQRMEKHNFYRIEGLLGKNLGQTLASLITQKRDLGLNFAIDTIYMPLNAATDAKSQKENESILRRSQQSILQLNICKLRDIDVIFLILIATLFYFLLLILALLYRVNTGRLGQLGLTQITAKRVRADAITAAPLAKSTAGRPELRADIAIDTQVDRKLSDNLLIKIRQKDYKKSNLVAELNIEGKETESIGKFYQTLSLDDDANLFDKTQRLVDKLKFNGDNQAILNNIYPTVSLVDSVEEMVDSLRVSSVAEFDFEQFDQNFNTMSQAFERYQAQPQGDITVDNQEALIQRQVVDNFSLVAANADGNSVLSNLAVEFQERVANIFSEMQLEGYSKTHPGMQHSCGVPEGGTLILLYTHKDFFNQTPDLRVDFTGPNVFANSIADREFVRANLAGRNFRQPSAAATATVDINRLVNRAAAINPLDSFRVLADFFIPTMCCDGDCSELLDISEDTDVRPESAVNVTILRSTNNRRMVRGTSLTVREVNSKNTIAVQSTRTAFVFNAPAGKYQLTASAAGFASKTINLTLDGDPVVTTTIALTPNV